MTLLGTITAPNVMLSTMIAAVFLLAGLVKGVVGLGLPTISMAVLALMMTPAEAAALLVMPSLVTNVWQLRPWSTLGPMFRRLGPMQIGVSAGTLAGAWAMGAPSGAWAMVSLGAALIIYAIWGIVGAQLSVDSATENWLGSVVGAGTGVVTAATGVFVIPAVPYLQALGLQRDELIQAMGISFTVSTLALAAGLYFNGRYSATALSTSIVMLLPAIGGMYAGEVLRQRLSPALFRRFFFGGLILLGVYMIGKEIIAHISPPSQQGTHEGVQRETLDNRNVRPDDVNDRMADLPRPLGDGCCLEFRGQASSGHSSA